MHIDTFVCSSCAVASIANIGDHKDPVDVLKKFCYSQLGVRSKYKKNYSILTCYYIFCAGPEVKQGQKGGTHHSKNHWPKYGTELAAYIVDNELGEVATVGPKKNLKHHKTSTAQVWAWSPNQKALEKWWDENYDPKDVKKNPYDYDSYAQVEEDDY